MLTVAPGLGRAGELVAFGHMHKPWHREVGGIHFVNTGSVGRPKDGDWRAGGALLKIETDGVSIVQIRVEYDLDRATDAIRARTLPDDFAPYLETGGMPG